MILRNHFAINIIQKHKLHYMFELENLRLNIRILFIFQFTGHPV